MTWFRRIWPGSEDLDRVQSEIECLAEALGRHDERAKQVEDVLAAQPDAAALASRIDALATATGQTPVAELTARLESLTDRIDALEARITSVSTELANQLSELGNDIDELQQRPAGEPIDEDAIVELRDTQTRLANEQARYQIAFREDLARLAEQLRRPEDPRRRR